MSLVLSKVNKVISFFEVAKKLLSVLSTDDNFIVSDCRLKVLSHLYLLFILTDRVKVDCIGIFGLSLGKNTLLFELSSLHSDMSFNLKGLLLSISLSNLCLFEGIGFCEDHFGLLLGSLLSLSLIGISLNSLDALFLLSLNNSDLHLGLSGHLYFLEIDIFEDQSVSEIIHLFLVLLQGQHGLVVLIKHTNNNILYKIKWILPLK